MVASKRSALAKIIETHEGEALLAALVELWGTTRSPRLADAIERLGRRVDDGMAKTLAAVGKAGHVADCVKRMQSVSELDDDPRITVAIVGWLAGPKWPGSGVAAGWTALFARLVALRDARAVAPLRAIAATPPDFQGLKHTAWIVEEAKKAAAAIEAACAETRSRPEDPSLAALEAKLEEPVADFFARKRTGAAESTLSVVQYVFDDPHDDDVRRVAADALLEREDPWGELINIQLRIADGKATAAEIDRAKVLLFKHGGLFAGPLAKITKVGSRIFEKGFLAEITTDATMVGRRDWEAAATAPHWATVRKVQIDMTSTPIWWVPAWANNPANRFLRELNVSMYQKPMLLSVRDGVAVSRR